MTYDKTIWKDTPSTDTPITAANLNNMENGIYNLCPVILYRNESGSNKTITLSQNAYNFSILDILGKTNDGDFISCRVYSPNRKHVTLTGINSGTTFYVKNAVVIITDNKITFDRSWELSASSSGISIYQGNYIFITHVIGYK